MTISYSTNWMGPIAMWWFRDNGFTNDEDEITEHWYGGRIDIYGTNEPYGTEMSLPIMDGPSWRDFSEWLEKFETDTEWTLDQLVSEYEKTHNKIRWHNNV